jgi:hypothetical protein
VKRKLSIAGIVIGAVLALAPVWGIIGTVLAIRRSMIVVDRSGGGNSVGVFWSASAVLLIKIGLMMWPVGIALCIFSIIKLRASHRLPPSLPPPAQGSPDSKT